MPNELSKYDWEDDELSSLDEEFIGLDRFYEGLAYAEKQFEENNIPFRLCNPRGHFNLLKDNKVVMSFWSSNGRCYIPSREFSEKLGIDGCIEAYKKIFG